MNRLNSLKWRLRTGIGLALAAAALYAASSAWVVGADTPAADTKAADAKPAKKPEAKAEKKAEAKPEKAAVKKFTGEELWAMNCSRCHAERYPTEYTAAEWKSLVTHMRVRANLPAAQARAILKYLQADSGN